MAEVILIVERDPEVHYMREACGGAVFEKDVRRLKLNDWF